jgi:predicted ATP-binding protein involved in virulence
MQIDTIHVTNFKGFKDREFKFSPQFNLIIGANATGKTSILDALSIAIGSWLLGLRGYDTRHIWPHEVHLACNVFGDEYRFEPQYPTEVYATGTVLGQRAEWARGIHGKNKRTTTASASEIKDISLECQRKVQAGEAVTLPLVSYYGTQRLWQEPREAKKRINIQAHEGKQKLSRLQGYKNSIDPRISVRDLTKWIAEKAWTSFQRKKEPTSFQVVREALISCLENATELSFDPARREIVINTIEHGVQPFSNLSDGQRNILALVGDIAEKAAILNPHLGDQVLQETPGVILIDELDLHLHPTWQRRIVEDLRRTFPKIQFIASTHSPFIIQTLKSDELISLDTQPLNNLSNKGIEEISAGVMGVIAPQVSPEYQKMLTSAREYLAELDIAAKSPKARLEVYKRQLAEKIAYADNPAFQAILEAERKAKLGE